MRDQIRKQFVKALVLIVGIASAQSARAQTFKLVKVKDGSGLVQVAAGGVSVWALSNTGGHPYIYQGGQFVLANNIILAQIAVGGGNTVQADTVWALSPSGKVYKAAKTAGSWVFTQIPGTLSVLAVGPGVQEKCHPYEVWGLNSATQIFRYDFCTKAFTQVPGSLVSLAVGGGDMWGTNNTNAIFRYKFATGGFDQLPGSLSEVAVGPDGLWGLYTTQIYEFHDNIQNFAQLSGVLNQIQAGGNGVWGLNPSGNIFRLEPSTSTFVQVPGSLVSISVGSGSGVWGINSAKQAYRFSTP